jgi:predicted dienelactone hydrolase
MAAVMVALSVVQCSGSGDKGGQEVAPEVTEAAEEALAEPALEVAPEVAPEALGETDEAQVPPQTVLPSFCYQGVCSANADNTPDPTLWGPFPVGVKRMVWVDESQENKNKDGTARTLITEIWYPAAEEARAMERFSYDLIADGPEALKEKTAGTEIPPVATDTVKDAPVRQSDGPFPLVGFSHGAYGVRFQSVFFTAALASHGYIVVSPDHQNNVLYDIILTGYDAPSLMESAVHRPKDMTFVFKKMEELNNDPASEFHGVVDMNDQGMTGHSFGGTTCYPVAVSDVRMRAIVPFAPAANMVDPLMLIHMEDWSFPTLMMASYLDKTLTPMHIYALDPWNRSQPPKWFLEFKRGGHYTFSDICKLDLDRLVHDLGYVDAEDALNDGCDPTLNWDADEAHKAINQYAIAFLNWKLRGSTGSLQYLTLEAGAAYGDEIDFLAEPE